MTMSLSSFRNAGTRRLGLCAMLVAAAVALVSCGGYEAAQKAYNLGEYDKAAKLFNSAQKDEKNKVRRAEECFLLGECYRKLGLINKAVSAYSRAVQLKYDDDIALLRLADCYRQQGKLDQAEETYAAYREKRRTDVRGSYGLASVAMAREAGDELTANVNASAEVDSGYAVTLFKEANSKYSDFCPQFVGDGFDIVYFSSMRMEKKRRRASKITGQGRSTLYMTKIDGQGRWTIPEALEEPFGQQGFDDGAAYVSPDGRTMLFTRCPLTEQEGSPAQAYECTREGGRWSDPVRITPGGDSTLMVAHPTLSPDGQTLYFVSDKAEGSVGGLDIWKALRNVDGSWGPAQNMGAFINSPGDEMFPYVRQDGTLYFSSNGHKGYGGLDIFRAVEVSEGRYEVSNMGLPINSTGDDFGIAFMGTAEEGLLSSNRGNARGYDAIYHFSLPPVILTIEGTVGKSGKRAFEAELRRLEAAKNSDAEQEKPELKAEKSNANSKGKSTASKSKPKGASNSKASQKSASQSSAKSATASAKRTGRSKSAKEEKKEIDPIPNSFVRIVGSDGTNIKMEPNEKGFFSFVAEKDVRYVILAGAPGYANKRTEISTEGLNRTQSLTFTALLDKVE